MMLSFSGHLTVVNTDKPAAQYHGTTMDDLFSGTVFYGDVAGEPDTLDPDEAGDEFAGALFGGFITTTP